LDLPHLSTDAEGGSEATSGHLTALYAHPSPRDLNAAATDFVRAHNWSRAAIVYEAGRDSSDALRLQDAMLAAGVDSVAAAIDFGVKVI